jgi:hypothetical protein
MGCCKFPFGKVDFCAQSNMIFLRRRAIASLMQSGAKSFTSRPNPETPEIPFAASTPSSEEVKFDSPAF